MFLSFYISNDILFTNVERLHCGQHPKLDFTLWVFKIIFNNSSNTSFYFMIIKGTYIEKQINYFYKQVLNIIGVKGILKKVFFFFRIVKSDKNEMNLWIVWACVGCVLHSMGWVMPLELMNSVPVKTLSSSKCHKNILKWKFLSHIYLKPHLIKKRHKKGWQIIFLSHNWWWLAVELC